MMRLRNREMPMIKTADRAETAGDGNTLEHDEIDLSDLNYRTLTPERWAALKRQVVRRGRVERKKVVREMLDRLIFWRGKQAAPAPLHPALTAGVSFAVETDSL
jgi:hypothetical protein